MTQNDNDNASPQDQTNQSSAQVLPAPGDRFNQALGTWFAQHQGAWSGTASELISAVKAGTNGGNDLWLQPTRALYSHLESHKQELYGFGVDVLPYPGLPRMVSLRPCRNEKAEEKPPSIQPVVNQISNQPNSFQPPADQNAIHVVSDPLSPEDGRAPSPAVGLTEAVAAGLVVAARHSGTENSRGCAFENTAEALFGIVEMRERISRQSLDLDSTMNLVSTRAQEITGSSGVVVAWLQQNTLAYPAQIGIAAKMTGLPSQAKFLRSCISKGTVMLLPDARNHPLVGASCLRESISSVMVAPIFRNRNVAGVMELFFKEMRCFSGADVMTLELIADLLSERAKGALQKETEQSIVPLRITENVETQYQRTPPRRWTSLP